MAVGSKCKPFGGQVADLSPIGEALTTGVFITGEYRFLLVLLPLMRELATVNAWITIPAATVNAWITWTIHSFLGITFDQAHDAFMRPHALPFLLIWVRAGFTIRPCSVASTCTCP